MPEPQKQSSSSSSSSLAYFQSICAVFSSSKSSLSESCSSTALTISLTRTGCSAALSQGSSEMPMMGRMRVGSVTWLAPQTRLMQDWMYGAQLWSKPDMLRLQTSSIANFWFSTKQRMSCGCEGQEYILRISTGIFWMRFLRMERRSSSNSASAFSAAFSSWATSSGSPALLSSEQSPSRRMRQATQGQLKSAMSLARCTNTLKRLRMASKQAAWGPKMPRSRAMSSKETCLQTSGESWQESSWLMVEMAAVAGLLPSGSSSSSCCSPDLQSERKSWTRWEMSCGAKTTTSAEKWRTMDSRQPRRFQCSKELSMPTQISSILLKCGAAASRAARWLRRAVKARMALQRMTRQLLLTIFSQMISMRRLTVWLSSSPKGRQRLSSPQVSELSSGLGSNSSGMKNCTVRFWNCPFRYLFLRICEPILLSTRMITSFSASQEDCSTPAEYSTNRIISDLPLQLSTSAMMLMRSSTDLLRGSQARSSSRLTYSTGSSLKRASSLGLLWQRGSRQFSQSSTSQCLLVKSTRRQSFLTTSQRQQRSVLMISGLPLRSPMRLITCWKTRWQQRLRNSAAQPANCLPSWPSLAQSTKSLRQMRAAISWFLSARGSLGTLRTVSAKASQRSRLSKLRRQVGISMWKAEQRVLKASWRSSLVCSLKLRKILGTTCSRRGKYWMMSWSKFLRWSDWVRYSLALATCLRKQTAATMSESRSWSSSWVTPCQGKSTRIITCMISLQILTGAGSGQSWQKILKRCCLRSSFWSKGMGLSGELQRASMKFLRVVQMRDFMFLSELGMRRQSWLTKEGSLLACISCRSLSWMVLLLRQPLRMACSRWLLTCS